MCSDLTFTEMQLLSTRVACAIRTHWGKGVYLDRVASQEMDYGDQLAVMFEGYIAEWPNRKAATVPYNWKEHCKQGFYERGWLPLTWRMWMKKKWPVRMRRLTARAFFPEIPVNDSLGRVIYRMEYKD